MAELHTPNNESLDNKTEEEKVRDREEETKQRNARATENATNSEPNRSEARKPPNGQSNQDRVRMFQVNRNSKHTNVTRKKQTPAEKRKQQIQQIRDESAKKEAKKTEQKKRQKAYEGRQSARDEKIASMGKKGSITGLGLLGAAVDGLFTYQEARAEDPNGSKLLDLAKAGAVAGAWLVAEPIMWGVTIAGLAKSGAGMLIDDAQEHYDINKSIALHVNKDESGKNKGTLGGKMVDNEYAATSRQRQEQIMRNHKISTESILGSEARQLHR